MRVVRGSTVTLVTDPYDAAPTALSATVTRADGTELAAPAVAVSSVRAAVTLTAAVHTDLLDILSVAVVGTVNGAEVVARMSVDVVGAEIATVAALRQELGLGDSGRFPDPLLADYRDGYVDYCEQVAGRAFTPRLSIVDAVGRGARSLTLPVVDVSAVRAATIDGQTIDTSDLTILAGCMVARSGGWSSGRPVTLHVEHGKASMPARLTREIVRAVRRDLLARGAQAPSDTLWETIEGQTVRYATPDARAGRPTGLLALDAVLDHYTARALIS